jgi:hypothetical protein
MSDKPTPDSRINQDRRDLDVGPPFGKEERRLTPERRLPKVVHSEFDAHIDVPPVAGEPKDIKP